MTPPPSPQADWALFLDVDGTLIDIAPTPSAIRRPPELPALLEGLSRRHGGAVALISGRSVDNLRQLMAPARLPAAGLHGLERLDAGDRLHRPRPLPGLDTLRRDLAAFAAHHPGVVVEDKGLSLALHYRLAPACEEECQALAAALAATTPGFQLAPGKMVFELRPAGADKGTAIAAFLAEAPFRGRIPVFAGDDLTDESGFAAVAARGGFGVRIGAPQPSAAAYALASPAACRAWLASGNG